MNELLRACFNADWETVTELVSSGAAVNVSDEDGWTPLMYAAAHRARPICRMLIKAGVDINAKSHQGTTALILASDGWGDDVIVHELIQSGADIDATDVYLEKAHD